MDSTNLDGQLASLPGRYARALFELGDTAKKLGVVQDNLNHFNTVLETVENFKVVLLNPAVQIEEQIVVLGDIAAKNKYDELFLHFLFLLCENQRLEIFGSIHGIFNLLVQSLENVKDVEVISRIDLTKAQQQKLQQVLAQATTCKLNFSYRLDPKVLGGFLVKIGCQVIDLSVINQINMLATEMKGNA